MTQWAGLFEPAVAEADPQVAGLLDEERQRQDRAVNLIASESYCPRATVEAEASILVNKNATGYPGAREVGGCEIFDRIEVLAQNRAMRLFGAEHANVQAVSSTIANIAVLRGLLRPGERILSLQESAGGHHSHGASYHLSGQDYRVTPFGVDETAKGIDIDAVRTLAKSVRPRMIIAGSTAYPRAIDFAGLCAVAREVGSHFFADIAHVAGLVAAGEHENPAPYADVVTTSTHKTFCGPRTGGLILCKTAHAAAIDRALFPGLQGAPGAHIIAGRAVLFELAGKPAFAELMKAVRANARALADGIGRSGLPLYLGGTDTHMVVVDLRTRMVEARAAEADLAAHGVTANRVSLTRRPDDAGTAGIRLGTVAMTIRGMDEEAFARLGEILALVLNRAPNTAVDRSLAEEVSAIAAAHPAPRL
jgi:glycine hydroxymethyltransferase